MKLWTKLLIAGGAIWYLFGNTLNTLMNLSFKFAGLSLLAIDEVNNTVQLKFKIAVNNPTSTTIAMKELISKVYFNGEYVADINQAVYNYINANGITNIDIIATIQYNDLLKSLITQLNTGIIDNWVVTLQGTFVADNINYPFDIDLYASDVIPGLT